ncbi:MAG: hypothetical protein AB198_01860 [Parcubacteria bacterium C7867-003]|nr:MAG: hypothetical protein AB198_01860 [Parcubacteria bacterium C7867-003]
MFDIFLDVIQSDLFKMVWNVVYYFLFVAIPLFLLTTSWDFWKKYRRAQFFAKQEYVLMEIKLPKEIFKSPAAMEFCLSAMHSTLGEGNWYEKYWKGQVRIHHSLEIVSIDGKVRFFIWTRKGARKQIESNIYSQYPGVEIHEAEDYTLPVVYDPETVGMWVTEFKLTKPDAFPIKTYLDYGLDKNPEEEYKLDPLTPLIEFLGSLDKGNQVWIQIMIRAHVAEEKDPSNPWWKSGKKDLRWQEGAKKEIEDIIAKAKGEKGPDGKVLPGTGRMLTEIESDTIKALSRSISKKGFDTGIRVIYHAPKDVFSMGNVGGVVGGIMHFNSSLNGFAPTGTTSPKYKTPLLAWKDRNPKIFITEKQDFLDAYKRREHFYWPFDRPHFILNTEELATIFHFPGSVSNTPTFTRIESKKSEAPSNLPV